uniref:NERD domain-containing protein n=1 Tax=Heterorhabditis bacteriophora TaxID=37862 RepID=A0A1I7WAD0_HETBA
MIYHLVYFLVFLSFDQILAVKEILPL